jgi:M6 family metalloprotease-like protein
MRPSPGTHVPDAPKRPAAAGVALMACAWLLSVPAPAGAQDVELLGEIYGTRPPPAYFQELARDPGAFRFEVEGARRLERLQQARSRGGSFRDMVLLQGVPARSLGPRAEPMVGTFRFPLVMGLFADSPDPPPFDRERIQQEFWDGPNSYHQTIPDLFHEMSRGLVELVGLTFDWVRVDLTREQVTRGGSGLRGHSSEGVGGFIRRIVEELDTEGVDWSQFDQSGDGFVDVLMVMHPTHGAECGGGGGEDRVWSHRWNLNHATQGSLSPGFRTSTPRPDGGGFIYVNDYTIQPVLACDAEEINQIGVLAHELGHGFGLPDLYGTGGTRHAGAGNWDLMGTGAWGCGFSTDPARPCHMGAWTKAMMGWVQVEELSGGVDHGTVVLEPVTTAGRVVKVSARDGTRNHLLLENRQRIGSQSFLFEPGLLVWQVDQDLVDTRWTSNTLNSVPSRLGVRIRAADGRADLERADGNRGDPGDVFPGCIKPSLQDYGDPAVPCDENPRFHAGSTPASFSHAGTPMGITLKDIERVGPEPFAVRLRLSTRLTQVDLVAEEAGSPATGAGFVVDGDVSDSGLRTVLSAPFQTHRIEATPGASVGDGIRVGFEGWDDGLPRVRSFTSGLQDTVLVASYGGREVRVAWSPESPVDGIVPASLNSDPVRDDLWFPQGAEVTLEARPRTGFRFLDWVGAFEGRPNPLTLTMDEPIEIAARFDVTYGFAEEPGEVAVEAARILEVRFTVQDGNAPIRWTLVDGALPEGLTLNADLGTLNGAAMEMGSFPVRIRARDAIGLEATVQVVLEVGPPVIPVDDLVGPFLANGRSPTFHQRQFLDRHGNRNDFYDLGDLRAFILEHGVEGASAAQAGALQMLVPMGEMRPERRERREPDHD